MGGKCDKNEGDLNQAHPFPRVWDIREGLTLLRLGCVLGLDYYDLHPMNGEKLLCDFLTRKR